MKKKLKYNYILKQNSGFTVLELIITIVLIGILFGIAIIRFNDLKKSAQTATCRAKQQTLNLAQRLYYIEYVISEHNGKYATDLDELAPYLKTETLPECPNKGSYLITADGQIECTVPDHHPMY